MHGFRYSFASDLTAYIESVKQGTEPLDHCEKVSNQERAMEYILLRMRTLRGIEEWEYRREFYMNFEPIGQKLEKFEKHGWAEQTGNRWHFTGQGFLLSNQLIGELLDSQGKAPDVSFDEHYRSACKAEKKNVHQITAQGIAEKSTFILKSTLRRTTPVLLKIHEQVKNIKPPKR